MFAGIVLQSFIYRPVVVPYSRDLFMLDVRADDGTEHHLISVHPPDIFSATGEPITLAAEFAAGSRLKIQHDGRIIRAIQVIEHVFANPFATRQGVWDAPDQSGG
jgi:hypothetical protein